MSDTTNEQITEQLWEAVVLQYPEVSNAEYQAEKVGNHEFAKVCNNWLKAKVDEKFNNLPDPVEPDYPEEAV